MESTEIEVLFSQRGTTECQIEDEAMATWVKKLKEKINIIKCKSDVLREYWGEFLGTFILTLLGNAVVAVIVFNDLKSLSSLVAPIGWGLAVMVSIYVTGGVSGCHANPAVTLSLATVGKCSWKKVLPFFFAQYAGAFVSSAVLYGVYFEIFTHYDGGNRQIPPNATATAQIFATYLPDYVSIFSAVVDQIVGTAMLMLAVLAITDPNNMAVPKGSYPLVIGLTVSALIFAFPLNCGAPLNPARDLGPRVFTAIAGWGKSVFSFRDYNYFWVPVVGPHIGGIIGAWIYKLTLALHWPEDSYYFKNSTEVKTNEEFKKKEDFPYVDKMGMVETDARKVEE